MAGSTFERYDRNRFRKGYPFTRRRENISYRSSAEMLLEEGSIAFSGADSGLYTFSEVYESVPNVVISAYDSGNNDEANVSLHISSITTQTVTVKSTTKFTGTVNVQVMKIS